MKAKVLILLLFVFTAFSAIAQDSQNTMDGTVTFITSNNVYVKFSNTEKITIGATLFFQNIHIMPYSSL